MSAAVRVSELFPIERVEARAYRIPTDSPESDGTFEWDSTTLVVVHVTAGARRGLGYTYGPAAVGRIINSQVAERVRGLDAMDIPACWAAMGEAIRNDGDGPAMMALAAVDSALWDLKARLFNMPLARLLGMARGEAPAYGSGGFTSYSARELRRRMAKMVGRGFSMVKMKVGREPENDVERVSAAREATGRGVGLMVDANGAYDRKQALSLADDFAELGVTWFEEPVCHRDFEGLRMLRDRTPAAMEIASGEYAFNLSYVNSLLDAGGVDVLQLDATRCSITVFLQAAALAEARGIPVSTHCAPALNLHPACSVTGLHHVEYFHDHERIEYMLFDGAPEPAHGMLAPDLSRPGMGLELKARDAERYEV